MVRNSRYGPNFWDNKFRMERLKLQKNRDILTGEKIGSLLDAHFHHIDYNPENDNPDNLVLILNTTHMKITGSQETSPVKREWYKRQLTENLRALKEGRSPLTQTIKNVIEKPYSLHNYHWSYKESTISSRIESQLYDSIKNLNLNQIIQNFIRKFLRSKNFRKKFNNALFKQFSKDYPDPILQKIQLEPTNVIAGLITTLEKELMVLYFTVYSIFSVSYALRLAVIHYRNLDNQDPISFEEVPLIMKQILEVSDE